MKCLKLILALPFVAINALLWAGQKAATPQVRRFLEWLGEDTEGK